PLDQATPVAHRPRGTRPTSPRSTRSPPPRYKRDATRGGEREDPPEPEPPLGGAPIPLGNQRPETPAGRPVERPREPRLAVDRDASPQGRVGPAARRDAGQGPADGHPCGQRHDGGPRR